MERNTECFKPIEDAFCVLWIKGTLKQSSLYERKSAHEDNPNVYAKYGSGYIGIYSNGATSSPNVKCKGVNCKGIIWKDGIYGLLEVQSGAE